MSKSDLVEAVIASVGLSKNDAEQTVSVIFEKIKNMLKQGTPVDITKFGKFNIVERAGREGRNPQTGAPITIKPSKGVTFKSAKALKESVQ